MINCLDYNIFSILFTVYFYVVSYGIDHSTGLLKYQFKPYSEPEKYIAVINGDVTLAVGIIH